MNRMITVGVATLAAASILLIASSRRDRNAVPESVEVTVPVFRVEAELGAEGLDPYRLLVPKDHEVHLIIHAHPDAPEGMARITGYEDVLSAVDIGPGVSREFVFVSSRPGDDFALMVGDKPLGRLFVTGSHLEEGHQ